MLLFLIGGLGFRLKRTPKNLDPFDLSQTYQQKINPLDFIFQRVVRKIAHFRFYPMKHKNQNQLLDSVQNLGK